jgi:hypothetical protein
VARNRRRLWQHGLAIAACGLGALTAPTCADPPPRPATPTVPIEMWRGVERIDVPPPVANESTPAVAQSLPVAPAPALLPVGVTAAESNPACGSSGTTGDGQASNHTAPRLDAQLRHAVVTGTTTPVVREVVAREATESPGPAAARAEAPRPPAASSTDLNNGYGEWRLPVLCLGGAVLLTPLVFAFALAGLLRRLGGGPLLRIEYVNSQPPATYPPIVLGALPPGMTYGAPAAPSAAPTPAAPPVPAAAPEPTGQPFELGPTFEEELRLQQDQAQQQEHAVLQHLFEENLKLQRDVREAETAPV